MEGDETISLDGLDKPRNLDATREILERIARALGQSASIFFDAEGQETREAEAHALVIAFSRITDSHLRAKCIAFVNAEAAWEEHN